MARFSIRQSSLKASFSLHLAAISDMGPGVSENSPAIYGWVIAGQNRKSPVKDERNLFIHGFGFDVPAFCRP